MNIYMYIYIYTVHIMYTVVYMQKIYPFKDFYEIHLVHLPVLQVFFISITLNLM